MALKSLNSIYDKLLQSKKVKNFGSLNSTDLVYLMMNPHKKNQVNGLETGKSMRLASITALKNMRALKNV